MKRCVYVSHTKGERYGAPVCVRIPSTCLRLSTFSKRLTSVLQTCTLRLLAPLSEPSRLFVFPTATSVPHQCRHGGGLHVDMLPTHEPASRRKAIWEGLGK